MELCDSELLSNLCWCVNHTQYQSLKGRLKWEEEIDDMDSLIHKEMLQMTGFNNKFIQAVYDNCS